MSKTSIPKKDPKGKGKAVEAAPVTEEVKKPKKPEKSRVRRIHVSGLPAITEAEVKDRFKSFGTVEKVDGLGKIDGNGNPLRYVFMDVNITKSKLAQCMNLLSGSMWKGSTLKISEAKPTFMDRIAKERKDSATIKVADPEAKEKKTKKRKRNEGGEGEQMDLVNANNAKSREGWKLDPQSSTPLFPIVARPDHPLPPLPAGKKLEKVDKKKKEKLSGKEKKKEKAATEPTDPPTRAHRVKIDTTKWKPEHKRRKELSRSTVLPAPSQEEMVMDEGSEDQDSSSDADASRSASALKASSRSSSTPISDTHGAPAESSAQDEDVDDTGASERAAHMALIASMTGVMPERISAEDVEQAGTMAMSVMSSEDENVPANDATAMLSESEEEAPDQEDEADAPGDEDSEWSSGAASEDDVTSGQEAGIPTVEPASRNPTIQMQSLTEMFKPQETGSGFSLGNLLDDFDLEDLPEPSAEPAPAAPTYRQPVSQAAPHAAWSRPTATFDPQEPLFFPFPFEEDEKFGGILYNIGESERSALLDRSWTGLSEFKRFKRTQNMDEITTHYETARKTLNEQVRKRHREAVKSRRRTGGKRDRTFAQDDL